MGRLADRMEAALALIEASEEGVSDPVTPQLIQAEGLLGQAYDAAKFAVQGTGDALKALNESMGDAMAFVRDLKVLADLPRETQDAFEQNDEGFELSRLQDIVADLETAEQHANEARRKFVEALQGARRYRQDISDAAQPKS